MVGGLPVLRAIDELLGMLDAHAHGERLLLHAHARVAHELERVAGRMAARQHNAACGNQLGDGFGLGYLEMCIRDRYIDDHGMLLD